MILRACMRAAFCGALLFVIASSAASAGTIAYSYDSLGRLSSVTYPSGAVIKYNYDPNGNRTSYVVTGSTNPPPTGTTPIGQAQIVNQPTTPPSAQPQQ